MSRNVNTWIWRQGVALLGLLTAPRSGSGTSLGDLVTWIVPDAPACLRADRWSPVLVPDSDRRAVAVTVVDPSDGVVDPQAYGCWEARRRQ